ncbi:cytochrome P450 [Aspergillus falconensis]
MGLIILLPALISCLLLTRSLYRHYKHPFSSIPGPKLAAYRSLWLVYHTYIGDECSTLFALHRKYGSVLRIAPKDIDIASGDAMKPIYLARGGFPKTPVTIFWTLTLPERATRVKAIAPLFSTASIRNSQETLLGVVDDFVERLRQGAQSGWPVNVLDLARAMAIDAVSAYVFQERYGAFDESAEVMSAPSFVDAYVGVGAFFNFAYGRVGESLASLLELSNPARWDDKVLYGYRRLHSPIGETRGLQKRQLPVSCLFAGTDSTGMNTATIIWYLVNYPGIYTNLRIALQNNTPDFDPLSTPYLHAVVREGLRLSWAIPVRLPRSVPAGGWRYKSYFFPAGTSVGISAWQLHQEESVFPDPLFFKPERWLEPNGTRACIAQNLGTAEVTLAIYKVTGGNALRGARILEWSNSRVKGEEILVHWIGKS